jgi:hypothetical protein
MQTLHEQLGRVVLVGRDLADVLAELTTIARRAMPGSEAASITLIRSGQPSTVRSRSTRTSCSTSATTDPAWTPAAPARSS